MSNLRLQSLADTITTTSNIPSGCQDHATALRTEVTRVANTFSTRGLPFGFKRAIEKAIIDVLDEFDTGDPARSPKAEASYIPQSQPMRRATWRKLIIRREDKEVEGFLGTIYINSKTSLLLPNCSENLLPCHDEDQYEHETSIRILPAQWLISLGLVQGLHALFSSSSISGWKSSLDTIRPRPDDALIFDFCKHGNLAGVKSLLERGLASPKDVDSAGRTPLHVSINSCS